MRVIDRLSKLPPDIYQRVVQIAKDQKRQLTLQKRIGIYSVLTIRMVINVNRTIEGKHYWDEVSEKYHSALQDITDQEYLIYTMDPESHLLDSAHEFIVRASRALSVNNKSRKRDIVYLRNAMWDYCYNTFDVSLEFVGVNTFPKKPYDHASVLYGIRNHQYFMSKKDQLAMSCEEKILNFINK